jgi:hypothetical protein
MTRIATEKARHAPDLPLSTPLRLVHDRWLREVRNNLTPATLPSGSTIWERWGAVRYLADEFNFHFGCECSLVDQLHDRLEPGVAARLVAEREALEQIRAELDVLGRRHGTAGSVSVLARALIDRLSLWCAEIEAATRGLAVGELDQQTLELLAQLEAAPVMA